MAKTQGKIILPVETTTRAVAVAAGLTRYFTGKPCKHGHVDWRRIHGECITCLNAAMTVSYHKRHAKTPDKVRAGWRIANAKYYAANQEKECARHTVYHAANADSINARHTEWRLAKLDETRARQCTKEATRRAVKRTCIGSYTEAEVIVLFGYQKGKCAYSGFKPKWCKTSITLKNCERDHIMPLAKKGSNDIRNIQLLCGPCNAHKHATDPFVFVRRLGGLI